MIHNSDESCILGQHGFDNMLLDMHPVFIARGPAFKKGLTHYEVVKSVDMFALVGNLAGFPSDGRNGSLSRVLPLLAASDKTTFLVSRHLLYDLSAGALACFISSWLKIIFRENISIFGQMNEVFKCMICSFLVQFCSSQNSCRRISEESNFRP